MLNFHENRKAFRGKRLLTENDLIREESKKMDYLGVFMSALAIVVVMVVCFLSTVAKAEEIDLNKIMMIETGGRNIVSTVKGEHAIGLYQITPIVLKEFNNARVLPLPLTSGDLWNPTYNRVVAGWYLNKRIPQMLRAYKKPATVRNILIAYNAGISYVVKGKPLPDVTKRYLKKYGVA